MFECWFGLAKPPILQYRLLVAGELIHDILERDENVLKCFKTNTWKVKYMHKVYTVSEDLKHNNLIGNVEAIRRITLPTERENTPFREREVLSSDRKKICPVQTSDGALCGTVSYLVDGAYITGFSEPTIVLDPAAKEVVSMVPQHNNNDSPSSLTPKIQQVPAHKKVKTLELNTNLGSIHVFVDKVYLGTYNSQYIHNLENILSTTTTTLVLSQRICNIYTEPGRIIPATESEVSYACTFIPYRLHNPPIRSMFASSMIKQAISTHPGNSPIFDGMKILDTSKTLQPSNTKVIYGHNLTCAIMPWYGYNIEDAVIISETTAKLFRNKTYTVINKVDIHIISLYVKTGQVLSNGDKILTTFDPTDFQTINHVLFHGHNGSVVETIQHISKNHTRIIISYTKNLEVGDKMASRHGQKGVISLILPDIQMPFYYPNCPEESPTPKQSIHIIVSPHAFPSRMTMGQIKEMGCNEQYIYLGVNQPTKKKIIVGECFYMALRQQVADKIQYRVGDAQNFDEITKQPVTGKINSGGLRFGQMERDVLIAKNAWKTIRYIWGIDEVPIFVDNNGFIYGNNIPNVTSEIASHQYFKICLAHMRALGFDILLAQHQKSYSIVPINKSRLQTTNELMFGHNDVLDVRIYRGKLVLPICLRTHAITRIYNTIQYSTPQEKLNTEVKRTLKTKKGIYHSLIEGHVTNYCIRSVITPDPTLDLCTVYIPIKVPIDKIPFTTTTFSRGGGEHWGILNRQPTLSTKSMMLVKLKQDHIRHTNTIRMNPKLCKLFNADFDGDEMNIYIMTLPECTEELKNLGFIHAPENTQDYILIDRLGITGGLSELTEHGLTANQQGIELMIHHGSKGKQFNLDHIYNEVGLTSTGNVCKTNYSSGLAANDWYELAKGARSEAASIGLNTPISGQLESLTVSMYI
jgi:hypothetical protein